MSDRELTLKEATAAEAVRESSAVYAPSVDVYEDAEGFVLLADLPGADPEKIDVRLEGETLSVYARVPLRQAAATAYHLREYGVGDWARTFRVGEAVDATRIEAEYVDGVLKVRLPKSEAAKPRRIPVRRK